MRRVRPSVLPVRLALLLAVCALAMRTMVPAGFMLVPGAGMPRLMLCDGMQSAATPMAMPMDGAGHSHRDGHPAPEQPCAFSAAAFAADVAAVVAPPAPVPGPTPAVSVTPLAVRPGAGLAAPPPWPTGPPAIA